MYYERHIYIQKYMTKYSNVVDLYSYQSEKGLNS